MMMMMPVHLQPKSCCLTCHHLQCRCKKFQQLREKGTIVSKVQIGEGGLSERHPNRAQFDHTFQQPVHTRGK